MRRVVDVGYEHPKNCIVDQEEKPDLSNPFENGGRNNLATHGHETK